MSLPSTGLANTLAGASVAFIGLGVMGHPMAGHLARAGYRTRVFNRTSARADDWLASYPGEACATPAAAANGADVVLLCVGNDDDVRSVTYGDAGVLAGLSAGALLIDHTTASAELARELYQTCASRGIHFLDAPVSGGQAGAERGQLTIMVGGDAEVFDRAQALLATYAKAVRLMGPSGCGQLTKMVNQICIAGVLQGLAEGMHFAERAQLDVAAVMDVISKGAAQSWQMENRAATMARAEFDFGFAVNWMRKDLGMALDAARSCGATLPLTALVDQFYADVQNAGGGRFDTSSLIERLRR
jgi:3-hydroxyisobutyrate dehydrogenase-like beta-hydroxyacid dehydrogenase